MLYIAPECHALCCVKCPEASSKAENACWGCNTPFDDSKPSKPFETAEKEIIAEESGKSKKDPELKK